uniref:Ig-like domain-containing protein n=1 Tax=Amphilophus citrinellus TaxID=61819 RepID=A0A3Q0RWI8_AMPCI
ISTNTFIISLLLTFSVFSSVAHEITYVVGCFDNGTTEVQYEFDAEELLYVDFERHTVVYTVPADLVINPSQVFENLNVYNNAMKAKRACPALLSFWKIEEEHLQEDEDPPESILYAADEVELGVENSLICFVNYFYPPSIKVSWTKNGHPVSEGVSLSRYFPNKDQTFHQFSTLTFTPSEGDIYSCTVEHSALETPKTRIWETEIMRSHQSLGSDVFCAVGLTLGLLGVATGTFLIVKGLEKN